MTIESKKNSQEEFEIVQVVHRRRVMLHSCLNVPPKPHMVTSEAFSEIAGSSVQPWD